MKCFVKLLATLQKKIKSKTIYNGRKIPSTSKANRLMYSSFLVCKVSFEQHSFRDIKLKIYIDGSRLN